MKLIISLKMFIQALTLLPSFLFLVGKDKIHWYLSKGYKIFDMWGLHIFVGKFGAGKTSSMIHKALQLSNQFPQLTIVTNLKLINFPKHTKILPLCTPKDILNAPDDTLVLIDEIGTIFNSRDFASSKESVPKILFQHLCQCRKRHMMIYATTQRWNFLDKQLRDIVATVRSTRMTFSHPFSRMGKVKIYDSVEYDKWFSNPLLPLAPINGYCYIQSDKLRNSYDTAELINSLLDKKYIPDSEILANQGYTAEMNEIDKKAYRKSRKTG